MFMHTPKPDSVPDSACPWGRLTRAARSRGGFTVVEVVVAVAVFSIVVGAAVALSQFQAKKGAASTVRKMANEAISLAIMQIRRDIVRSGFGLLDDKETGNPAIRLALLPVDGTSGAPDKLLVSYSDHIEMDLDPTKQNSFFGMFSEERHGLSNSTKAWVWWSLVNQSLLQMPSVNTAIDGTCIGGVITMTGTGTLAYKDSDTDGGLWSVTPVSGTQNYYNKTQTLQVKWSSPFTGKVAPAIVYSLNLGPATNITLDPATAKDRPGDYPRGQLLRNGVPLVGAATADIDPTTKVARPPYVKVTDFQIRCGFYIDPTHDFSTYFTNSSSRAGWTPDSAVFGSGSYTNENLRAVEITVKYICRDKAGGNYYPYQIKTDPKYSINSSRTPDNQDDKTPGPWSIGGSYTVIVSPRTLVLGRQLGAEPYGS